MEPIHSIKMSMISKTYKFTVSCQNCGIDKLAEYSFGIPRPNKVMCDNCGCMADTKATVFNQNINFKPLDKTFEDRKYC